MCPLSFSLYDICRWSCWVGGANGCLSHREHCMLTPRLRPSQRRSGEGAHDSGVWKRSVRLENVMSVYLYICWWEHGSKTMCAVCTVCSQWRACRQRTGSWLRLWRDGCCSRLWLDSNRVANMTRQRLSAPRYTHTHACFLFLCHAVPYWCVSLVWIGHRCRHRQADLFLGFKAEPCARFMRWHGTICLISIYCGFLSAHNAWAVPLWGVFVEQECPVLLLKG